ncbi:hypothetical protein [Rhizobium sp. CC-YZS058]|uniref:hypothetical protein n=1 Tax=Rhizobium sp. CC-YZS058 TaxID=3042153 RepID=UPI002B05D323|nr:hypothetical protein [Rhizobium sp. CC-YZS058]MEA3533704.1 hypothetical protein [Rhizobium sp. CC-YZS058]
MKRLTQRQEAYLQSATVNPTGRTLIRSEVLGQLHALGLVEHEGYGIARITDAGRAALMSGEVK